MEHHVLLIEDDARIRQIVERGLGARDLAVDAVPNADSAVRALRSGDVDLVLLDLGLPDADGFALLGAIRAARPRLPVIVLTARDDMGSKLDGLNGGADDYVTKPFSIAELAARIHARLRWREEPGTALVAGALTLDLATHRATFADREAIVSAREASLLAAFLRRPGELLSRDELLRLVWEIEFDPGSNVVDVYVAALRRKLGPEVIETVRGRGYRLRAQFGSRAASR
jgi:two-component system, OmpR family, copper resistance phosphate regulon response regulator CusR